MKQKLISIGLLLFIATVFSACAPRQQKTKSFGNLDMNYEKNFKEFFADIQPATDASYGLTADNPIKMKNNGPMQSVGTAYYFIQRIRTINGAPFKLQSRSSLRSIEGGPTDRYTLQSVAGDITITLYINIYVEDEVKIPMGLKFEHE